MSEATPTWLSTGHLALLASARVHCGTAEGSPISPAGRSTMRSLTFWSGTAGSAVPLKVKLVVAEYGWPPAWVYSGPRVPDGDPACGASLVDAVKLPGAMPNDAWATGAGSTIIKQALT